MSLVRCPNGHVYNARRYGDICPYCSRKMPQAIVGRKTAVFGTPAKLREDGTRPVCGWLVCIEGTGLGNDYKIHIGKNFISSGAGRDIRIEGDNGGSCGKCAIIVYDTETKKTVILPEDFEGAVYVNEKAVYVPGELQPYDVIRFGKNRFLFVPLCGTNFDWENL